MSNCPHGTGLGLHCGVCYAKALLAKWRREAEDECKRVGLDLTRTHDTYRSYMTRIACQFYVNACIKRFNMGKMQP
jgi:hypothetical protein